MDYGTIFKDVFSLVCTPKITGEKVNSRPGAQNVQDKSRTGLGQDLFVLLN